MIVGYSDHLGLILFHALHYINRKHNIKMVFEVNSNFFSNVVLKCELTGVIAIIFLELISRCL